MWNVTICAMSPGESAVLVATNLQKFYFEWRSKVLGHARPSGI